MSSNVLSWSTTKTKRQIRCGASTCACNHPELLGKDAPNASTKNNFAAWLQARSAQLPQIMPHTARCTRSPQGEFERMVRTALNLCAPAPAPAPDPAPAPGPARNAAISTVPSALAPTPSRSAELLPGQPRSGQPAAPGRAEAPGRQTGSLPDLGSPTLAAPVADSGAGGVLPPLPSPPPRFLRPSPSRGAASMSFARRRDT